MVDKYAWQCWNILFSCNWKKIICQPKERDKWQWQHKLVPSLAFFIPIRSSDFYISVRWPPHACSLQLLASQTPSNGSENCCEKRFVHFLRTRLTQKLRTYGDSWASGSTKQFLISDVILFVPACDSLPDNKQFVQEGKEERDNLDLLTQSPKQCSMNLGFEKGLKLL